MRVRLLAAVVGVSAVLGACSDASSPLAVAPRSSAVGENPYPSVVNLCKIGTAGTTATFSVSATSGTLTSGSTVTVAATAFDQSYACVEIWRATTAELTTVTVTEVSASSNAELKEIIWLSGLDSWGAGDVPTKTATVRVDWDNGALIWFKNAESAEPPLPAIAGCTPGFWRQAKHHRYWTAPYTPSTMFGSVFSNAFPGKTLGQVVRLGGGGLNALGRHTVAALLNAASPEVQYGMTPSQVISAFNAAYASRQYRAQKDAFEASNQLGCTINKRRP